MVTRCSARGGPDVEVEQPRQREVDLLHLVQVEPVAEAPEPGHVLDGQAERVVVAQPGPRAAVELDVGRGEAVACMRHAGHCRPRPACAWQGPSAVRLQPMCGIVGYVGPDVDGKALDVVMEGLARLEYRGYDSAGVALVDGDHVATRKRAGKLANLVSAIGQEPLPPSSTGIGHTRWATHGGPTDVNAHPHRGGDDGKLAADPQRHHRELPRPPGRPAGRRRDLPVRDRHRGRRPAAGPGLRQDRRPDRGHARGRRRPARRLHPAGRARRPARGGRRRPPQQPPGRRPRRRRDLPRLRRRRVHRAHPRGAGARPGPDRRRSPPRAPR